MSEQLPPELIPPEPRYFNHSGFNQYLVERRLMAARCTHCGVVHLPPRPMCPRCYHSEMEWVELSGEGRLEGFTIIHVGLPAMVAYGYHRQNPYCTGVVRLLEGPAVAAQILTAGGATPTGVQVGAPLRAVFLDRGDSNQVALAFETVS